MFSDLKNGGPWFTKVAHKWEPQTRINLKVTVRPHLYSPPRWSGLAGGKKNTWHLSNYWQYRLIENLHQPYSVVLHWILSAKFMSSGHLPT